MDLAPLVEPGTPLTTAQKQRFSRHLLLPQLGELGQRRLLAARVLVVGAGGLGSPILLYLAAAGVGHLGIIDDDVVEESNLQRQVVHGQADVGRSKVESAAQRVAEINPDAQLSLHQVRLTPQNAAGILSQYDLVLDGTDNFPTRYLVDDTCAELGLPLIWGSILRFDAQVSVFWAQHGPTLRDLFPKPPPEGATPTCGEAGVLGAMCGQVGSLMAAEAVKLITGAGEPLLGRVAVLDVLAARWHEIPLRAGADRARDSATRTARVASEVGGHPVTQVKGHHPSNRPAVTAVTAPDPVPTLTAHELAARLSARQQGTDTFVLLDVRESGERDIAVIGEDKHIPLAQVLANPAAVIQNLTSGANRADNAVGDDSAGRDENAGEADNADWEKPLDVVVYCLSGPRSHQAAAALQKAAALHTSGVTAFNLTGGIRAWTTDVNPTLARY